MKKEMECPQCQGRGKVPNPENVCVVHEIAASSPIEVVDYINKCYHENLNWNFRIISIFQREKDRWVVFFENLNVKEGK